MTTLCPALIGLASSLAKRLELTETGAHLPGIDLRHLDRVQTGLDERPAHFLGEHLGALIGPDEVVADGRGDRVLQFRADLRPVIGRVTVVDDLFGVLRDRAEASAQIMVDIGCQVGDSVVEHLLPQRRLLQRILGFLLAPLQLVLQPVPRLGIVERGQLGLHPQRQMLCGRTNLGEHLVADPVVLTGQHLLAEELDDGREIGLLVEFLVVVLQRVAAQQRRGRDHRQRQTRPLQMRLVGRHDLAPVRIEVGLRRDDGRHRADLLGLPDEPHLGFGELLAGVADHQHGVGIGQQAERGRQVRLPVAADAGGVDERQALLEQRTAGGDLDPQHLAATGFRRATQIVA